MDAFQIAVQYFDPTIEERLYREEPFFLSVDEVLGRPPREKPEEPVGDRIPPISHLIGEPGFLFSSFFGHMHSFLTILQHSAGLTGPTDPEGVSLGVRQQENQGNQPETDGKAQKQQDHAVDAEIDNA